MVFLILLHLSFTIIASYIPLLSFLFLSHCIYIIDTRITKKKDPEDRKKKIQKKHSPISYMKKMQYEIENSLYFVFCVLLFVFFFSVTLSIDIEMNMRCVEFAAVMCVSHHKSSIMKFQPLL